MNKFVSFKIEYNLADTSEYMHDNYFKFVIFNEWFKPLIPIIQRSSRNGFQIFWRFT